jgi:hypothetical protein
VLFILINAIAGLAGLAWICRVLAGVLLLASWTVLGLAL